MADVLRGDLIDRDAGADVFAFGAPGMNAAEESRAGAGVIGASVTEGIGLVMREIAQDQEAFAVRAPEVAGPA